MAVSIKDYFTSNLPKLVVEALAPVAASLSNTELSLVIDISGDKYACILKDGKDMQAKESDLAKAMLRMKISKDDMQKMIDKGQLDLIQGIMTGLNKLRFDTIARLQGSFVAELANDDGSNYKIEAIFNDVTNPSSVFKMTLKDSTALAKKETSPVTLYMSGAMKIEGDMSFAMATQPLFT
jgi:putative sterol carrier protein